MHAHVAELAAARSPGTAGERHRYPFEQWAHGPSWVTHGEDGEAWIGLSARPLDGLPDVALVPLASHSRGHSGMAERADSGCLLHAGDAYNARGELEWPPRCPPHLRLAQRVVATDYALRLANLKRLRELPRLVRVFSAHDAEELAAF
ncbi:hypothetical protein FAF44_49415 [Nonomuraea sp. MG754425]|uniref:hypothetical protein n=1 Tax=Nonomuraea sp. MG754425 TaxID=2570319 RepID=UPI001F18AA8B|nr:hypothetical protein [Nonomuraea sp. MG754425]MCF6476309.1 hypothetical protein [Nonomuraea sp. MG754425]